MSPTPKPKTLRPWRPEEVPLGAVFRNSANQDGHVAIISRTVGWEVEHSSSHEWKPFDQYKDDSIPWTPCGVEE